MNLYQISHWHHVADNVIFFIRGHMITLIQYWNLGVASYRKEDRVSKVFCDICSTFHIYNNKIARTKTLLLWICKWISYLLELLCPLVKGTYWLLSYNFVLTLYQANYSPQQFLKVAFDFPHDRAHIFQFHE